VPRRILLLITDLEIGGTPTVVREVAIRLHVPPDVHVAVACLAPAGPVAEQLKAANVPVHAFGARSMRSAPRVLRHLIRHIGAGGFDTVFSFLVHANVMAALASRFVSGVRFFQSIQTTQPNPAWHWRLQRRAARRAERIAVPSSAVAHAARERSQIPAEKLVVIPNAVDAEQFRIDRDPPPGPFAVGFIGRLDPIKRLPDLLTAIKLLDGRARLHVFGEGEDRSRVEADVRRLGLESLVTLHGAIAQPQDALRQLELLVLPSSAEGFGLVLIEAMAAGVPVVATDIPAARDIVHHGETGLLVPVGSPEELAAAIRRVMSDYSLRHRMAHRAQEDVRKRFAWDGVMRQYRAFLGIDS